MLARGLGDIAMQVLVSEVAEPSDVGALEKGPETLYPVCVRHASHILSDPYHSLVPAMGWTVDTVFRVLERRFVIHSVITDCVYDDKK